MFLSIRGGILGPLGPPGPCPPSLMLKNTGEIKKKEDTGQLQLFCWKLKLANLRCTPYFCLPWVSYKVGAGSWRPEVSFSHEKLTAILSRHSEVASASKKGRKSVAVMQMKTFDDCFHTQLNTPVPASNAKPQKTQLTYAQLHSVTGALLHQDAILKEMKTFQIGGDPEINAETDVGRAVLHNLQPRSRTAEWIDLEAALKGPAYVAKLLIKKLQDGRSKPGKPYRVNAEQLECTALFVAALEKAFAKRPEVSKPWLHPAEVLMTILTDGGWG